MYLIVPGAPVTLAVASVVFKIQVLQVLWVLVARALGVSSARPGSKMTTGRSRVLSNLPRHKCDPAGGLSSAQATRTFVTKADAAKALYVATHDCEPPPSQVIRTETTGILLRQFRARAEHRQQEKDRQKRGADDASETARKKARKIDDL